MLPLVFVLNFEERGWEVDIASFVEYYNAHCPGEQQSLNLSFYHQRNYISPYRKSSLVVLDSSNQSRYLKLIDLPSVMIGDGSYLWLLKPADWNRGEGVHVFSNLNQLQDWLVKYYNGWHQPIESDNSKPQKTLFYKCRQFVIQKYIEKPFLINQRKFDIRCWVLMTHTMKFYLFREGYIRTSSEPFDLNNVIIYNTPNGGNKRKVHSFT